MIKLNGPNPEIPRVTVRPIADDMLRLMNHSEWLTQFALVLEQAPAMRGPGQPAGMTPFEMGAIGRLRLAVQYIELLQKDARALTRRVHALDDEIRHLKREVTEQTEDGR